MAFNGQFLKQPRRSNAGWVTVAVVLLSSGEVYAMCPMCRLAANEAGAGFGRGLFLSYLLLASIPLVVFGICGYLYFKLSRKTRSGGGTPLENDIR